MTKRKISLKLAVIYKVLWSSKKQTQKTTVKQLNEFTYIGEKQHKRSLMPAHSRRGQHNVLKTLRRADCHVEFIGEFRVSV